MRLPSACTELQPIRDQIRWAGLTMSSGLLTAGPVGLATEAVDTTLPGTVAWTVGLPYGGCEALL